MHNDASNLLDAIPKPQVVRERLASNRKEREVLKLAIKAEQRHGTTDGDAGDHVDGGAR